MAPFFLIPLSIIILIFGAEMLVRGSSSLAKRFGIPSIIVGLTVVAVGTSAPELFTNIFSAVGGQADIGLGNIIGSNISNILLILGISALITPLAIQKSTVRKDMPVAVLAMIVLFLLANNIFFGGSAINILSRADGFILIGIFVVFLYFTIKTAKSRPVESTQEIKVYSRGSSVALIGAGLVLLFFSGRLLVSQSVILARVAGLSEALIGATIIAIGTSIPELVTSIIAAIHKQKDLAIGNIVGSNIFNIFWVLGLTASIAPIPFNTILNFDIMVGLGASILLILFVFTGKKRIIERWEGGLFVLSYLAYVVFLIRRG